MQKNSFRIIAGQWRGRRLAFPEQTSVRPTGDRVRETVFNWLQPYVAGSRVLDLFAGSGAMGLEALSRGAATATFVEKDQRLVAALKHNLGQLNTTAEVQAADVLKWLPRSTPRFNLVFLDPPYPANLWLPCLEGLAAHCLDDNALVYTEQAVGAAELSLPAVFTVFKTGKAGQVRFMLLRYQQARDTICPKE